MIQFSAAGWAQGPSGEGMTGFPRQLRHARRRPVRPARTLAALALAALAVWAGPAAALDVELSVAGDEGMESEIRGASLLLGPEGEDLTAPQDVLASARADYTRIVGRLYARGYFGPVVNILIDGQEAAAIAPLDAPARIGQVQIAVRTGPAFALGAVSIAPLAPDTELPEDFVSGQPASTGIIREAATAAVTRWQEIGRARADVVDQSVVARHPTSTLDVALAIRPGPVVSFGRVTVSGAENVRTKRILEIAGIPTGQRYDPFEIERAETRLRRTGTFRAVAIEEPEGNAREDVMPLDITVVEALPRRIGAGAEINSNTGLSLQGYWMHRNLLGGAERLRFDLAVDGIGTQVEGDGTDYSASALFTRPATFRSDTDLSFRVAVERENEPNYSADRFVIGPELTRYATDELTLTAGIEVLIERSEDATGERSFRQVSFPVSAEYDRRNDPLDPTGGYYIEATARPFAGFGDSETGARATLDLRGFEDFGPGERIVAALRLEFGTVIGSSIAGTPPGYLFYSGGTTTVRGQPFESLGVPVGDEIVGGRSRAVIQSEIRYAVTEKIGAVGFLDAGFIGEGSFGGDGEVHAGAGLGARYKTGIGPIRLDVGLPVAGGTGNGVQLYIGIGQAF